MQITNSIPKHSLNAMLLVFCLLLVASCVSFLLKVKNKEKDYTELRQRVRSWWIMIVIIFIALISSYKLSVIFFAFLSYLALKEFFSIVNLRQCDRRVMFWAYLSILLQYYFVYIGWYGMFIIFIPVYIFLFLPIRMVLIGQTDGFIKSCGVINWGVMFMVFCLSHIAYLLALPIQNQEAGSVGLVLFLIFITQFNDVCQYIWGKIFGKHKIIAKVSPNKTWEGFLGGAFTTSIISFIIAPYLTPISGKNALLIGFALAVVGFFGDVVISCVKRDLKIKDSSNLIPGHGGILDRMDSLIYTAPLFFHIIYYLYY
jgi:phosphatidate cytidylyltransferase